VFVQLNIHDGREMRELVVAGRKRKNIKVEIPALGDYLDKL